MDFCAWTPAPSLSCSAVRVDSCAWTPMRGLLGCPRPLLLGLRCSDSYAFLLRLLYVDSYLLGRPILEPLGRYYLDSYAWALLQGPCVLPTTVLAWTPMPRLLCVVASAPIRFSLSSACTEGFLLALLGLGPGCHDRPLACWCPLVCFGTLCVAVGLSRVGALWLVP